jgi:four helix bundle protein
MPFKFEKLDVWQSALDYIELTYTIAAQLPRSEEFNLRSQLTRAATSVALNIAEGSIGQTDAEQARFLGMAIRSLVETVACQHIIGRHGFIADQELMRRAYRHAEQLVGQLHRMRRAIQPDQPWLREEAETYIVDPATQPPPSQGT